MLRTLPHFHLLVRRCCSSTYTTVPVIRILQDPSLLEKSICVQGWAKSLRKQKEVVFLDLDDGSYVKPLQIVCEASLKPEHVRAGAAVTVRGVVLPSSHPKQKVELQAHNLQVVGSFPDGASPVSIKKRQSLDYLRQHLHLRNKNSVLSSVMRIRNSMLRSIHEYHQNEGFFQVTPPVITSNDCEGAGETFTVKPSDAKNPQEYFSKTAYLTVSSQLHLEAMASCLKQVYTVGPAFRAENSRSSRHLCEFTMLEVEIAFLDDMSRLLKEIERMIQSVTRNIIDNHEEELHCVWDASNQDIIVKMLERPFIRMSYAEACEILKRSVDAGNLSREEELKLVQHCDAVPVFVTDWPTHLKPFYSKVNGNMAAAVDAFFPLVGELCGGSLREDSYSSLVSRLKERKLFEKLEWYTQLRKYGGAPLGGYGMGIERYLQYLTGLTNIKDVIPFPRWPHHCDM